VRFFSLQSPGGEFHGGTKRRSNSLQFRVTKTCSPPEGNFTEERGTSAHCQLCTAHPVAVPRRGISRRNLRTRPGRYGHYCRSCSPPEGNFTEERHPGRRPRASAAVILLQSPGGEFHGGTRLTFANGWRRRQLRWSCSPPEGNFTEEPVQDSAVLVGPVLPGCSPPEGNFTEEPGSR
jgi:hypothetical protein